MNKPHYFLITVYSVSHINSAKVHISDIALPFAPLVRILPSDYSTAQE